MFDRCVLKSKDFLYLVSNIKYKIKYLQHVFFFSFFLSTLFTLNVLLPPLLTSTKIYYRLLFLFFSAAEIQPKEVKWRLMVTSCYRRLGSYQKALELYESIHKEYPQNLECLRYLVAICKELGKKF